MSRSPACFSFLLPHLSGPAMLDSEFLESSTLFLMRGLVFALCLVPETLLMLDPLVLSFKLIPSWRSCLIPPTGQISLCHIHTSLELSSHVGVWIIILWDIISSHEMWLLKTSIWLLSLAGMGSPNHQLMIG